MWCIAHLYVHFSCLNILALIYDKVGECWSSILKWGKQEQGPCGKNGPIKWKFSIPMFHSGQLYKTIWNWLSGVENT